MKANQEKEQQTFESLMTRLDEIADGLDSSEVDLDRALHLYEEGASLLRSARQRLDEIEGRVRQLRESDDGAVYAERLDEDLGG